MTDLACDCCNKTLMPETRWIAGNRYAKHWLELTFVSLPYVICEGCSSASATNPHAPVWGAIIKRAERRSKEWAN